MTPDPSRTLGMAAPQEKMQTKKPLRFTAPPAAKKYRAEGAEASLETRRALLLMAKPSSGGAGMCPK